MADTTIKRLVIDDMRDLPLPGATVVRTVAEAMPILFEKWDEIWLDFDMGGKPYETDVEKTIMPVVNALEESGRQSEFSGRMTVGDRPVIFIHTQNPVGRDRITKALDRWYHIEQVMLYVE